jgi:hypothetical protein
MAFSTPMVRRFVLPLWMAFAVLPAGPGCHAHSPAHSGRAIRPAATVPTAPAMVRTDLYFGLSRPDGRPDVSDEQFGDFLAAEVTPHFPAGLTVSTAAGQWRDPRSGQITRERSRVLTIFHALTPAAHDAIERIRTRFKEQFRQDSVLRADAVQYVSF